MIQSVRRSLLPRPSRTYALVAVVLLSALVAGLRPSVIWIGAVLGLAGVVVLLRRPILGLPLTIIVALLGPIPINTGTEVNLNLAALLVPALFSIWLLMRAHAHDIRLISSPTTRPLVLFLLTAMMSIFIGNVMWDPSVPKSDRFIIVQFAQWGLFAFSAFIFWLIGSLIRQEMWLRRLTATFLIVGGALAIVRALPGGTSLLYGVATFAVNRAPFWMLLAGLACGQLLFNQDLSRRWRTYLIAVLAAVFLYAFGDQQERTSNWLSVAVVIGVLVWFRLPKLRWVVVAALTILLTTGMLFQAIYTFAGGDAKWEESGASRFVLIGRVIELSMRNPITGIGPAAYRPYGTTRPLLYERAYWQVPLINSHNNYIDLFSQTGIIGLGLFIWFMIELLRVAWRLRIRFQTGFAGGYMATMVGLWFSTMIIMALADWFLPFVYNIGFPGFQASVLVWMFFGGVLFYEQLDRQPSKNEST